jgi:hypothetical protein
MLDAIRDTRLFNVLIYSSSSVTQRKYDATGPRWDPSCLAQAKRAKTSATTIAAKELRPASIIWPILIGTSIYEGVGRIMVLFPLPEGYRYLHLVSYAQRVTGSN